MARLFAILTVIATFILVGSRLADIDGAGAVSKMLASTGFIAVAVSLGARRWTYGRILLAGLFFSWWGDSFLIGSSQTWFLLGLVSFLIAHIMYCLAFAIRGVNARWALLTLPAIAVVTGVALWWLSPHVGEDMIWPVRVYTGVISLMVILAFGAKGGGGPWSIPIGAVLFYLSDLSVASGQFVKPDFPNYVWGLPFYFIGQLFLAWSAAPPRSPG